jgi:hypothetical protein
MLVYQMLVIIHCMENCLTLLLHLIVLRNVTLLRAKNSKDLILINALNGKQTLLVENLSDWASKMSTLTESESIQDLPKWIYSLGLTMKTYKA